MSQPLIPEDDRAFYALVRSDMASLNPGKAMAQVAHAQRHADFLLRERAEFGPDWSAEYAKWCGETPQAFGTTLVLDVGGLDDLRDTVAVARKAGFPAGVVHDPTYPLKDGDFVHLIPVDTVGWVFGGREGLAFLLGSLNLHP